MSLTAGSLTADIASQVLRYRKTWRVIPRLEEYSVLVAFCQTLVGKIILLLVFGIGLVYSTPLFYALPTLAALSLVTAFPSRRRFLVACCTLALGLASAWRLGSFARVVDVAIVLALAYVAFLSAVRSPGSWFGRRPLVGIFGSFTVAVILVALLPKDNRIQIELWSVLTLFGMYMWSIGYSLIDARSTARDRFALQLGTYRPFWSMTVVPFPKGSAYLRRIEARDSRALAIAQIKGVKLFAWSFVLTVFSNVFFMVVHTYCSIPTYSQLFASSAAGAGFSAPLGWLSLISAFFERLLEVSIWGHQIIAICRMSGFAALRNTYRPLASRSIAEFWNRFYYYYKELLADFFFYPTFMRYFKRWPRLRLFAATFAAACLGNAFLTFFTSYMPIIQQVGLWEALRSFETYLVYSTLLAIGIGVSQLRNLKRDSRVRGHFFPAISVIGFFCVLQIFNDSTGEYSVQQHFRYLYHLFQFNLW